MEKYFYLIGILLCLPLWAWLFSKSDRRKDMLLFGTIFGAGAVLMEFLYARFDYWNPTFVLPGWYLEDFLYGFIFGGISAEIAEALLGHTNSKRVTHKTQEWSLLLFAVMTAICFVVVVELLGFNSIWAHIIPPLIVGATVVIMRPDLFKVSLVSGAAMVIIAFTMLLVLSLIYGSSFHSHWRIDNLLGIFVFNIPIEELLFAFSLGFGAANVYEFVFGRSLVKSKARSKK